MIFWRRRRRKELFLLNAVAAAIAAVLFLGSQRDVVVVALSSRVSHSTLALPLQRVDANSEQRLLRDLFKCRTHKSRLRDKTGTRPHVFNFLQANVLMEDTNVLPLVKQGMEWSAE